MSATSETIAKWVMAGTENTGEYRVIAQNDTGRIGVRVLDGTVRIRIEPSGDGGATALAEHLTPVDWKQPAGQQGGNTYRFSQVVPKGPGGIVKVEAAIALLASFGKLERNTTQRLWRGYVGS